MPLRNVYQLNCWVFAFNYVLFMSVVLMMMTTMMMIMMMIMVMVMNLLS